MSKLDGTPVANESESFRFSFMKLLPAVACAGARLGFVFHGVVFWAAVVGFSAFWPLRAFALDLDGGSTLITETIASRDRLRFYDSRKLYGAEAISERSRRHLQAEGGRIGNFLVFPSVGTRAVYDDNILRSSSDTVNDIRFEVAPEIRIKSQLPRHVLNMVVGANLVRYLENTDQNYDDYFGSFDGALHIDHAHTLAFSASSELRHELPGEVTSSLDVGEPVPIFHHKAEVGLTRDVGRIYGTLSAAAERFDYQDTRTFDGSVLSQDERDIDFFSTQLRGGYRFSPGYELVGKLKLLRQIHGGAGASDLNATGYEAIVGLAFETSPLLRWRVLGGYGVRDYDAPGVENVETGLLEARFEWLPTQKITIVGAASREFVDTVGVDLSGRVESSVLARVDFEILNNLVLSIGGKAADADFTGIDRVDRTYSAKAELQYYLNKNMLLSFGYEYQTRDSNLDAFDMDRNQFMVGAKFKY